MQRLPQILVCMQAFCLSVVASLAAFLRDQVGIQDKSELELKLCELRHEFRAVFDRVKLIKDLRIARIAALMRARAASLATSAPSTLAEHVALAFLGSEDVGSALVVARD